MLGEQASQRRHGHWRAVSCFKIGIVDGKPKISKAEHCNLGTYCLSCSCSDLQKFRVEGQRTGAAGQCQYFHATAPSESASHRIRQLDAAWNPANRALYSGGFLYSISPLGSRKIVVILPPLAS